MQNHLIPPDWQKANLGDISSDISYGYTASATSEPTGTRLLRITDIQNNTVNWPNVPNCKIEPEKVDKYRLRPGDLVFARTGATVGKSYLLKGEIPESVYASYLIRVRCLEKISIEFLSRYFQSPFYWRQITDFSAGIGQPNVNGTKLKDLSVPLPPLAEQKVIADKLDTLLAQVENTKSRLERIPQILKRFRQSVLAAAVNGRLMDSGGVNNESWPLTTLAQLCTTAFDGPFGSKLKSSDYTDSGIGVVRLENIKHLRFDKSKETFISEEKYLTLTKNKLEKSDLLFSSFVDEEIRACLFPFATFRFINKADCFCLRIDRDKALPEFVLYLLTSQFSYAQIKEHVQGVTRPRVNLRILRSLEFPVPPLQVQANIVRRVDQLFAHADRIEQQVNNALARVNNLTQSILAKAFRGELTEQWRKDNPELIIGENSAAALLERIKAERAAIKPAKKTRNQKATA